MQKLVYVPPGANQSDGVVLTTAEPYILSTISGVGGVEASILSADIAGMDGTYMQGVHIESREIPCTVYVHGTDRADMYHKRFDLISKLTPQSKCGKLYYSNDGLNGRKLVIEAIPRLPPDFAERLGNYNKADISFYCPHPFWSDDYSTSVLMGWNDDVGFIFPMEFNPYITFGNLTNRQTIVNAGSAVTPVVITVVGPANQPSVTNITTGQKIALQNIDIDVGQKLVINTARGQKSVTLIDQATASEVDAFQYIEPASEFWSLAVGNNIIEFDGGDQTKKTTVHIEYTQRYLGV